MHSRLQFCIVIHHLLRLVDQPLLLVTTHSGYVVFLVNILATFIESKKAQSDIIRQTMLLILPFLLLCPVVLLREHAHFFLVRWEKQSWSKRDACSRHNNNYFPLNMSNHTTKREGRPGDALRSRKLLDTHLGLSLEAAHMCPKLEYGIHSRTLLGRDGNACPSQS